MTREYAGDDVFDALLTLGWDVTVDEYGQVLAVPQGGSTLQGEIQDDGSIEWQGGRTAVQWVVKKARIKELSERAQKAKPPQPSIRRL